MDDVYILICTGDEVAFDGRFKATCKFVFKEDPLKTDKYRKEIEDVLKECRNPKYLSCVEEGTEELKSIKMKLI